jgi:hypothetical protein
VPPWPLDPVPPPPPLAAAVAIDLLASNLFELEWHNTAAAAGLHYLFLPVQVPPLRPLTACSCPCGAARLSSPSPVYLLACPCISYALERGLLATTSRLPTACSSSAAFAAGCSTHGCLLQACP